MANVKAPLKFAHIELGIAIMVEFDYGILKAEAQLLPNSYIIHPYCHLIEGFGLYYLFDASHDDPNNIRSFVFTVGGYHQALQISDRYPNPPQISAGILGPISVSQAKRTLRSRHKPV